MVSDRQVQIIVEDKCGMFVDSAASAPSEKHHDWLAVDQNPVTRAGAIPAFGQIEFGGVPASIVSRPRREDGLIHDLDDAVV
jgi:hypothetical protein